MAPPATPATKKSVRTKNGRQKANASHSFTTASQVLLNTTQHNCFLHSFSSRSVSISEHQNFALRHRKVTSMKAIPINGTVTIGLISTTGYRPMNPYDIRKGPRSSHFLHSYCFTGQLTIPFYTVSKEPVILISVVELRRPQSSADSRGVLMSVSS